MEFVPIVAELDLAHYCRRMYPRLVGALTFHCGDQAVAEDIAQETLTRVWERWPKVSQLDAPDAWTYRVAFNLANSRLRRALSEQRANRRSAQGSRHADADSADAVAVRQAMRALPKRQRTAVVLRYFGGLSVNDTAAAMGCAPGTVKALTSQAIAKLRTHFDVDDRADEESAR